MLRAKILLAPNGMVWYGDVFDSSQAHSFIDISSTNPISRILRYLRKLVAFTTNNRLKIVWFEIAYEGESVCVCVCTGRTHSWEGHFLIILFSPFSKTRNSDYYNTLISSIQSIIFIISWKTLCSFIDFSSRERRLLRSTRSSAHICRMASLLQSRPE